MLLYLFYEVFFCSVLPLKNQDPQCVWSPGHQRQSDSKAERRVILYQTTSKIKLYRGIKYNVFIPVSPELNMHAKTVTAVSSFHQD